MIPRYLGVYGHQHMEKAFSFFFFYLEDTRSKTTHNSYIIHENIYLEVSTSVLTLATQTSCYLLQLVGI